MLCQFCEEDKPLIEAHIIADCLLKPLHSPLGPMMHVSKGSYPKRLPTGYYDKKILCADCDNKFSAWEKYAAKLLIKDDAYNLFQRAKPNHTNQNYFYSVQEYDYASLKLCLLSILWKMSVSRRPEFKSISLGPFEEPIRQMLWDKNAGRADEFPTVILRLTGELDSSTLRPTMPFKDKWINCYELGLPGYVAIIKVDKRPTPEPIGDLTLAPGIPLKIRVTRSPLTREKLFKLLSSSNRQ